jgi:eIF-2B alpha/beta/delta-like uncharacterized protein
MLASDKVPDELLEEIRSDKYHGADYLSNKALEVLMKLTDITSVQSSDHLYSLLMTYAKELIVIRPSMAPMTNKLATLFKKLDSSQPLKTLREKVRIEAFNIINGTEEIQQKITEHTKKIIGEAQTVFTHSSSSTVINVINGINAENVICTESRPQLEGRNMAKELRNRGLNVLLVIDAAMGLFMESVDLALTGADSVLPDGSIINKVGTKMLAYAANDQGIPLYVVCDTNKFNVLNYLGHKIQLEEHPPEEVADLKGINVRNPYFEVVPYRLVTGIITEWGLMDYIDIKRNMEELSKHVKPLLL